MTDFLDFFDPEYIAKVGFPIAAFAAIFGIFVLIIKNLLDRQKQLDSYHDKSLKEIHDELNSVAIEMRTVSTKIDTYMKRLDQSEDKNITYIFREDKIDKIKYIAEKREVTQDIKKFEKI